MTGPPEVVEDIPLPMILNGTEIRVQILRSGREDFGRVNRPRRAQQQFARDDPRSPAWLEEARRRAEHRRRDSTNPRKGEQTTEAELHPQFTVQIECEDEATLADVVALLQRLKGVRVTRENPTGGP